MAFARAGGLLTSDIIFDYQTVVGGQSEIRVSNGPPAALTDEDGLLVEERDPVLIEHVSYLGLAREVVRWLQAAYKVVDVTPATR